MNRKEKENMALTYEDIYDPLTHPDVQFINILYCTPVGRLAEMDKEAPP